MDWSGWIYGLWAAVIGGGSTVTATDAKTTMVQKSETSTPVA